MMLIYQITNKNFIGIVNMDYKHKIIYVSFHNTSNLVYRKGKTGFTFVNHHQLAKLLSAHLSN